MLAAELAEEREGRLSRRLLGVFWIAAGVNHFVNPRFYEAIVPPPLVDEEELVVRASGVAEVLGGARGPLALAAAPRRPLPDRPAGGDLPGQPVHGA